MASLPPTQIHEDSESDGEPRTWAVVLVVLGVFAVLALVVLGLRWLDRCPGDRWVESFEDSPICSTKEGAPEPLVLDHADVDRQVEVDPAPPHLPYLPDYPVEVCGWAQDHAAVACFEDAQRDSRAAEIFFRFGTVEGDTIYAIGRLSPDGQAVLYLDYSDDLYAGPQLPFRKRACVDSFVVTDREIPWESCGQESLGW